MAQQAPQGQPLELAPRGNMALTLADSFLNDLDELEEEHDPAPTQAADHEGELAADLEEDEGSDGDIVGDALRDDGVEARIKLSASDRYRRHMAAIDVRGRLQATFDDEEEYSLIVESNEILVKMDAELHEVHAYVNDVYGRKFPELETLVPSQLEYLRVVAAMANEMDMTQVDLSSILPPTVVMVVSVTGSTTSGRSLVEAELDECLRGCASCLALEGDKGTILQYLQSRMSMLAPNLTHLVGPSLAALLVGMAGGLAQLARVPACNMTVMGQEKRYLGGFGMAAGMPHTGVLYFCDLVQQAPPALRRRALKLVANKAALCARFDAFGDRSKATDTSSAAKFREDIESKLEKACEPPKAQQVKALPPPDIMTGKKKRGGRRVRKAKEKTRPTEMRAQMNKRAFAHALGGEYGDDSMGLDFGLLGKEGGHLRATQKKEKQAKVSQKRRKMIQMSSGATNGLSSSLVFTPVQGIELANPEMMGARVDAANAKWFSEASGFQSALPQSKPGLFG